MCTKFKQVLMNRSINNCSNLLDLSSKNSNKWENWAKIGNELFTALIRLLNTFFGKLLHDYSSIMMH